VHLIETFARWPLSVRLVVLFLIGICLGSLVNLGIYRLAYLRRRISPWSRTRGEVPPRHWRDRLPVIGWLMLRREANIQGRGFWIRPMLIELFYGFGVAALYWWEVERLALIPPDVRPIGGFITQQAIVLLHWQFAVHVVLLVLLSVATFIDIDEQTIPDAITVSGTLIALILAAVCHAGTLPALQMNLQVPRFEDLLLPLRFDFPDEANQFLATILSLVIALVCYLTWCFALLPRHWRGGVGIIKAWRVMWRRIRARPEWRWILPLGAIGVVGIAATWWHGGLAWRGLFSALVGMAVGGGMIWIIRILAGAVLKREAMGFGDVTLMAMIGAFLGWQPVLIVFFLSPFAGALLGIIQWLAVRDNVIPYGPFLCFGALMVLVFWASIWTYAGGMFVVAWLVPSAIAVCLPVMILLLVGLRMLRGGTEA
jgi:leader peptidase (prepilin peptidase) / N-methyltransferase